MSELLRDEFNRWVLDGRAAGLEAHHRSFAEQLIPLMNLGLRERILEVGCGAGWASRRLAQIAGEGLVVGLDVSDEMIRTARAASAALENVLFVWGLAEQIPWQENYFTHALSIEAFYYVEHPGRALREIYRVLAPGGSVWILNHISKENEISLRWVSELKVPMQILSAAEYGELFGQCGFTDFAHRMIPDLTPDAVEYPTLRDDLERRRFRELGALLLTARKPEETISPRLSLERVP